jgi:hypothetical protein
LLGLDAGPEAVNSLDESRQTLLKKLDALARGQAAPAAPCVEAAAAKRGKAAAKK